MDNERSWRLPQIVLSAIILCASQLISSGGWPAHNLPTFPFRVPHSCASFADARGEAACPIRDGLSQQSRVRSAPNKFLNLLAIEQSVN